MTATKLCRMIAGITVLFMVVLAGCSDDDNPAAPAATFDIVGSWAVTEIEGAPPVDSSNSTWIFNADGTYEWFLFFEDIFDLNAEGNYTLNGITLTCDGDIADITETTTINLTVSNNNNTFSFLDGDGDRWTYNRVQ
ncbi:hypothetical protein ACFL6I_03345 [candidate division KSB1 bacterium]